MSDASLLKFGTRIGSVAVKAPRDPNDTADADDPSDEVDAPEGPGLDQGALARVSEPLTPDMLAHGDGAAGQERAAAAGAVAADGAAARPAARGAACAPTWRSARRRAGAKVRCRSASRCRWCRRRRRRRARRSPTTRSAITLTWSPAARPPPPAPTICCRRAPIGVAPRPAIAYNVYDTSNADAAGQADRGRRSTTPTYVGHAAWSWGEKRCYTVVAAETIGGRDDRERGAAADVRDAGRHVPAGGAEGAEGDFRAKARST